MKIEHNDMCIEKKIKRRSILIKNPYKTQKRSNCYYISTEYKIFGKLLYLGVRDINKILICFDPNINKYTGLPLKDI